MAIANVLTELMQRRGLNSNSLANAINAGLSEPVVHQGTIYKIAKGMIKDPGTEAIEPIAEFFGVKLAQLRGEEPLPSDEASSENAVHDLRYDVPGGKYIYPRSYQDLVLSAGRAAAEQDYHIEIEGSIPVPRKIIENHGWRVERLAVLPTDGLSMFPTIQHGEPVIINLDQTQLFSGKTFAIQSGDEGPRVKRLYDTGEGRIRVQSDNPDKFTFPDEYITPDRPARIVGRAYRLGELFSGIL